MCWNAFGHSCETPRVSAYSTASHLRNWLIETTGYDLAQFLKLRMVINLNQSNHIFGF